MSVKSQLLTALPAASGPQFLEVQRIDPRFDGAGDQVRTFFVNVDTIRAFEASATEGRVAIHTEAELLTVVSTIKSLKEALNFLRQTPHRASVVLRETWDGQRREPSLDDLDAIIPDDEATKV